ncbi:MAG TPA: phage protein Gp36 family protein, partial [Polyangiaceae bacterium]|nr:phage protein Gp36 family protein [Polyangiaceae bacterium]
MSSYCTVAQLLALALPQESVQNLSNAQLQAECDAASTLADSYLRGRYALPLLTFDIELSMQVAYVAAYNILASRGYNPEAGADSI